MSGVSVIRYLLANDSDVTTNVAPADSIKAGTLPQKFKPPAISVSHVSSVRSISLAMTEPTTMVTERVQVTLHVHESDRGGTDYPGLAAGMRRIRQACPNQRGTVNGVALLGILPEIEGPDLEAPDEGIIARSQDFLVMWTEPR